MDQVEGAGPGQCCDRTTGDIGQQQMAMPSAGIAPVPISPISD
jgi:hypothetical protein